MSSCTRDERAAKRSLSKEENDDEAARPVRSTKRMTVDSEDEEELQKVLQQASRGTAMFTKEEVDALLDPVFDDGWSQKDENTLKETVDGDPIMAALLDTRAVKSNAHELLALYKATLHALGETPDRIMSSPFVLDVGSNKVLAHHGGINNPNYNQNFCVALRALACHPLWEGDYRLLRVALGFYVACTTKDCRRWPFSPVGGPVLRRFSALAGKATGTMTMAALFREARGTKPVSGNFYVKLLSHIADMCPDDVLAEEQSPELAVYSVGQKELVGLINAVDTLQWMGSVIFRSAHFAEKVLGKTRNQRHPPSAANLPEFRRRSLLRERRLIARAAKEMPLVEGVEAMTISSDQPSDSDIDEEMGGLEEEKSSLEEEDVGNTRGLEEEKRSLEEEEDGEMGLEEGQFVPSTPVRAVPSVASKSLGTSPDGHRSFSPLDARISERLKRGPIAPTLRIRSASESCDDVRSQPFFRPSTMLDEEELKPQGTTGQQLEDSAEPRLEVDCWNDLDLHKYDYFVEFEL